MSWSIETLGSSSPARPGASIFAASTTVRRFSGPVAEELFVHCRPGAVFSDAARQAEALYDALVETLAAEGAGPETILSETVFFRRIREDFDAVRFARSRALGRAGVKGCRPATTWIQQPPLDDDARLELSAVAVVPRVPGSSSAHELHRTVACRCETCSCGTRAQIVRLGEQTFLHAGSIHGSGHDAFEEAYDMFRVADRLLADAGMHFGNVVRAWIYMRDVDRDYDALNRARRRFFRECGLARRPASTGVQGIPFAGGHDFSLGFAGVSAPRPLEITRMGTPLLNEAWTYGADFSRGLRVAEANKVTLHVSGTASIDEAGRTVHLGDFAAQVDRMLANIASLLHRQGATFDDLVSGVVYLKHRHDAPVLRSMLRQRGFDGFPCALVEAPLCRPELLCEAEAVALLPAATAGR